MHTSHSPGACVLPASQLMHTRKQSHAAPSAQPPPQTPRISMAGSQLNQPFAHVVQMATWSRAQSKAPQKLCPQTLDDGHQVMEPPFEVAAKLTSHHAHTSAIQQLVPHHQQPANTSSTCRWVLPLQVTEPELPRRPLAKPAGSSCQSGCTWLCFACCHLAPQPKPMSPGGCILHTMSTSTYGSAMQFNTYWPCAAAVAMDPSLLWILRHGYTAASNQGGLPENPFPWLRPAQAVTWPNHWTPLNPLDPGPPAPTETLCFCCCIPAANEWQLIRGPALSAVCKT
jgi:hypothetical protein